MIKEKKTTKKSPTKRAKKEKKVEEIKKFEPFIEKMGTNKDGVDVYRKFVTENSFIVGIMVNDEFTPIN